MEYSSPHQMKKIAELEYRDAYFDGALYLGDSKTLKEVKKIKSADLPGVVEVKNGLPITIFINIVFWIETIQRFHCIRRTRCLSM